MKGSSRCSRCGRAVETEGSLCSSCTAAVDRDNQSALISQGSYVDAEEQPAAKGREPPGTEAQGPITPLVYALGLLGWAILLATVVPVLRPYVYVVSGNVLWGWILAGVLITFFHGDRAWKWPLVAVIPLSIALNPFTLLDPLHNLPFIVLYEVMPLGIGLFAGSALRSWWSRVPEDPVTPSEDVSVLGRLRRPHFRIAAGTLGAALLLLLVNPWGAVGGSVTFPDANLEAAVRQALASHGEGRYAGTVSPWRMGRLSGLRATGMGIESLDGLEHARMLRFVVLSDNAISDLSPIAGFHRLDELYASHNAIEDLPSLAALQRLRFLDLTGNAISDLSPIADLHQLLKLDVGHNAIEDLSPLAGLPELSILDITGNPIGDFSPLAKLEVWLLCMSVTEPSDLSPLAAMPSLQELNLSRSALTPEQLSQLEQLRARGVRVQMKPIGVSGLEC